jgi:hypothetical protein
MFQGRRDHADAFTAKTGMRTPDFRRVAITLARTRRLHRVRGRGDGFNSKAYLRTHSPTVGGVAHLAPSGAPPPGQNTAARVSVASQLAAPSA